MRKSTTSPVVHGTNVVATAVPAGKRFLSDIEFEFAYGVPRKTLQNMRVLGRGPAFRKFGSSVRYDVADIEAWIESLPRGGAGVPSSAVKSA
jgi:predicted DNA-binding transcriptional regulator AlpA